MRHKLSSAIARLNAEQLLASRDTPGDVGIGQTIESAIGRTDLKDSFTAACKRLPEALRVLAEILRSDEGRIADQMERLRYTGYSLEKDIALFADAQGRFSKVRLYVLISLNLPADVFALAGQCIGG
jgi:hypothetical protein